MKRTLQIVLQTETADEIKALAEVEDRSLSSMARILLREALHARDDAGDVGLHRLSVDELIAHSKAREAAQATK